MLRCRHLPGRSEVSPASLLLHTALAKPAIMRQSDQPSCRTKGTGPALDLDACWIHRVLLSFCNSLLTGQAPADRLHSHAAHHQLSTRDTSCNPHQAGTCTRTPCCATHTCLLSCDSVGSNAHHGAETGLERIPRGFDRVTPATPQEAPGVHVHMNTCKLYDTTNKQHQVLQQGPPASCCLLHCPVGAPQGAA